MIKKLTTTLVGALLLGSTSIALAPVAAEAATTQKICSSKNSTADVYVYSNRYDKYYGLDATECVRLPKGDAIVYMTNSYKVGYGGDYSACRHNSGFTPWTKADAVYFRTYPHYDC